MKKWQQRRGINSQMAGGRVLIAKTFLGKDGSTPYVTPDELFMFNDKGRIEDIEEMSAFFGLAKERHRIIPTRRVRHDKGNNPYKFQNFNRNGNTDGAKVILIGRMDQLLNDMYDSKVVIDFTYDDLIEEAEQV